MKRKKKYREHRGTAVRTFSNLSQGCLQIINHSEFPHAVNVPMMLEFAKLTSYYFLQSVCIER